MAGDMRALALLVLTVCIVGSVCEAKCEFKAIFNFGASNVDTGGYSAAFPAIGPPNGMTYFKKPAGRMCDGRLIIDFLAQAFGFPFLSPYLQSIGSTYRHGANFAVIGSMVLPPNASLSNGMSPFHLAIQLNQMKAFKAKVDELGESGILPSPDIFGKSLYNMYIGQNDITANFASMGILGVLRYIPKVVAQIVTTIKEIYKMGGRTYFVLNLAPLGCYPSYLVKSPHKKLEIDEYGCTVSYNNVVAKFNKMLKDGLAQARKELRNASIIYVDTHSVYLELFRHPKDHGFKYGNKACLEFMFNGSKLTRNACGDPHNYVSWDGIHATEATNKILTRAILSGCYFEPPFSLSEHCDIGPIG